MPISLKTIAIATAAVLLALALWLAWLWQPERQVHLHQRHLLAAVEDRSWKRVAHFLAEDYRDRWGFQKASALDAATEVFRQFFAVEIQSPDPVTTVSGQTATVTAPLRLAGNGTAIAHEAIRRVNALSAPFVFQWRRASWKPWDWQLTSVDQSDLNISSENLFF